MAELDAIPIAIIGMSCRLPAGVNDPAAFWSMLSEGRSGWSEVPSDRYNEKSFRQQPNRSQGTISHNGAHFLDQDIRAFDASFFGISPSEASSMDPQHRIQLECTYEAVEDAGIRFQDLKGSNTAVYMATFSRDYDRMMFKDTNNITMYHLTGVGEAILSNRISYTFDLKGPSMTLDTGCSGGLVALHQACQSLKTAEANTALVGGVNLILSPDAMIPMSKSNILNSNGRCYPFDTRGRGYGRGEGVVALVLKRLNDALDEGYKPRAIIRNTGVNQDGKTQGISVPNSRAQQRLISSVYRSCGIDPQQVSYVEAHGTGTEVGDAAEMETIAESFCGTRRCRQPLYVGSVKSNIGHLESASGLAGLVKTVLVLENGMIPPNYDTQQIRKNLKWQEFGIQIPNSNIPWPDMCSKRARCASVNSFGYGGTNAHCILEATKYCHLIPRTTNPMSAAFSFADRTQDDRISCNIPKEEGKSVSAVKLENYRGSLSQVISATSQGNLYFQSFPLTSQSEASLRQAIKNLSAWLQKREQGDPNFLDLAYTLTSRRSLMLYRHTTVASSLKDLARGLEAVPCSLDAAESSREITFVFTGQGAQWPAMGHELLYKQPEFTSSLLRSASVLQSLGADWDLLEELRYDSEKSRISCSEIAQPATTALQIALVDMLVSLGVRPNTVIGHSSGEIAAAYAAGALDQTAALHVSLKRGLISRICDRDSVPKGGMIVVGLDECQSHEMISLIENGYLTVACVNSPGNTTISGDEDGIVKFKRLLDDKGVFNKRLRVDLPYHSHLMELAVPEYRQALEDLRWGKPKCSVKFISAVTADYKDDDFGPLYWMQNLTSKVDFVGALQQYKREKQHTPGRKSLHVFLEIGPHGVLQSCLRDTYKTHQDSFKTAYVTSLTRGQHAMKSVWVAAAKLFDVGVDVNLGALNQAGESTRARSVVHNLSGYPWDHSHTYWHESRLSLEHRQRRFAPHELLGVPIVGNSTFERAWTNRLSIETHPWLEDHVVDSFITVPGASYLCMAIEAIEQVLADHRPTKENSRYVFRDVNFHKAIVLREADSEVEVHFILKQANPDETRTVEGFWDFQIYSLPPNGEWSANCRGSIMVESMSRSDGIEVTQEDEIQTTSDRDLFRRMHQSSMQSLNEKDLYQELATRGNAYGSKFALLENVKAGTQHAVGAVTISSTMSPLVHPATLDALIHPVFPVFACHSSATSIVPVKIREAFISASFPQQTGHKLQVGVTVTPRGSQTFSANVIAFNADDLHHSAHVVSLSLDFQALGDNAQLSHDNVADGLAWKVEWAQDVDFLSDNWLSSCSATLSSRTDITPERKHVMLNQCAVRIIIDCLHKFSGKDYRGKDPHLGLLIQWMECYASTPDFRILADRSSPSEDMDTSLLGVEGEAIVRIGSAMPSIIRGETNPLEMMLENNLLYRIYGDDSSSLCSQRLAHYLELLAFKQPHMTILEIGAGTGSTTVPILRSMTGSESTRFRRYDFTDIAPSFFDAAQELLKPWSENMTFGTLDIEQDPGMQGFQDGAYDLIIAANVLHATSSIATTLSHVRKLLRPGGKLALVELTASIPYVNLIAGTLPGWWKGYNDRGINGPLLTVAQWNAALLEHEMTGVEMSSPDLEGEAHKADLMISSAIKRAPTGKLHVVLLSPEQCQMNDERLADSITPLLQANQCTVSHSSWDAEQFKMDAVYLILDPVMRPILHNISDEKSKQIRNMATRCNKSFWALLPGYGDKSTSYEPGLVTGFTRTARSENESLKLVTLNASCSLAADTEKLANLVSSVLLHTFGVTSDSRSSSDVEFEVRDGKIMIPRLVAHPPTNMILDPPSRMAYAQDSPFHGPDPPLRLQVMSPGLLESLRFVDDCRIKEPLGDNEIELSTAACGVNFKDVFIALGQMPADTPMAGECAGTVTAVAPQLRATFAIGDRVCALGATPYASRSRVSGMCAFPIPDDMSFEVGASVPVVFVTAYHSIVNVARLQASQTILIHAASGGVGQAAIMIAQNVGAEIFATVGSSKKREQIKKLYGIPDTHIFSSRTSNFQKAIMRITQKKGVNVALNSVSGQRLLDTWQCISLFGIFVEIGKRDIYRNNQIPLQPFDKNITFTSVDLTLVVRHQPELISSLLSRVFEMFKRGHLRPVSPITAFPISDIQRAFRMVQAGSHIGKLVLEAQKHSLVKSICPKPDLVELDHCGTYVIAGGLGALGLALCDFMARRGAGNLLILSRHSPDDKAQRLFDSLKKRGTDVTHMSCDITQKSQIENAAYNSRERLPPVKGIIQAAMVLKDVTLEQMSAEDLNAIVRCKTVGTTQLHEHFAGPSLKFFIMLSSLASIIGNRAQGNYAAGNGFLDHFAHLHSMEKTSYVSLNLGFIADSETISAHQSRVENITKAGCVPLKLDQMLRVLWLTMSVTNQSDRLPQLAVGLNGYSLSHGRTKSMQRPLFDHLRHSYKGLEPNSGMMKKNTIAEAMVACQDITQLRTAITDLIAKQLSSITATTLSELPLDMPLSHLGLDSLAAVELKNWISRNLQAVLETGEISDSIGIQHLADLVIQRSRLTPRRKEAYNRASDLHGDSDHTLLGVNADVQALPLQPLPILEDTLQLYKESVAFFCTKTELQTVVTHLQNFLEPSGLGLELHDRLVARLHNPQIKNWLYDLFTKHVYLKPRAPMYPTQTFFGSHFDGPVAHSQAERAAIVTKAILDFKIKTDGGSLEPDFLHDKPLCMKSHDFIFGAVREPQKGVDILRKYSQSNHAIIMRAGHYFHINLGHDFGEWSLGSLLNAFQTICNDKLESVRPVALLTGADRETWAEVRELLLNSHLGNDKLLRSIESAAFVICLDDGCPSDATERHMVYLCKNSSNRWKDKSVQYVVCSNGTSAYVCDHAGLEGGTLEQLNKALQAAIAAYKPVESYIEDSEREALNCSSTNIVSPAECFNVDPSIDQYVSHAAHIIESQSRQVEVIHHTYHGFGSELLRSRRCAPKSGFQLLIQLASLKYFGYQPPSWEPVQLRTFQEGRNDMYQAVLPSVGAFCAAMQGTLTTMDTVAEQKWGPDNMIQKRRLFDLAAQQHSDLLSRVARGHGFNHHLAALQEVLRTEEGEVLPALMTDPIFTRIKPTKLMTDCAEWLGDIQDGGMTMPDPEFVWVHYEIREHVCNFLLHGPATKVKQFAEKLDEAGTSINELLNCT